MPGFLGRLLLFADLLATVRSREEKFYFSDDDDYDSTDADTSLDEPASAAAVADPDGLGYKVGSHFHLNLEDNLMTTQPPPPTTARLPDYPSWRAGDAPIETTTGDLSWGTTPSSALFDVDTGDSNLKERSSIRPETSPHAESSSTTTVTSTTTTATTTKPTYTPASRIQETSTSLDMDCPDGYEARGLWVLINDPTRGYREGKHESIAAVSLICDDHLEQLKSSPSTPKASSQQQWTRLACMDRPDGQRVVMSAISTAAESESSEEPLMELRLQCSDGITVYGYAPTESRRMWREGEPCKEGMTAKGVRMAMKDGEMMSISTQCATACTRHDCGFQELRGSSSADRFTSVCGWRPNCHCDCGATSFVATSQSLSRIPLPSVPEVVAETAPAPLFPPQPSLMSQQIQQQTEVAQQANLQAIDEQRISQIERQENKLDAGMGELTATLDLSRKNLTSIKGALTEGLRQNAKTLISLVGDIASLIGTAIPTPSKDEDPMAILNRAEEMLRQQVVTARANGSFPPVPPQEQEKVKALSDAVSNIIRAETLNRNRIDQLSKAFESLHTELSEAGHLKDNHLVADSDYVSLLSADLNSVREGMDEDINSLHHISDVQARSMQALRSSLRALSKKVDSMVDKEEKDTEENSNKEETDAEEVDEELTARLESLEAKVRFLQNPANHHIFNPEDRVESLTRVSEVQEEKMGLIEKQLRTMVQRTSASTIRAHVDDAIEESKRAYGSTALFTPPGYVAIAGLLLALAAVGMGYVGFERSDKQLQDITYLNEQVSEIIQRIWPEGEEEYYGEEAAEEYAEEEQDVGEVAQASEDA